MIPFLYPERKTVETFAEPGEGSAFSERVKSAIGTLDLVNPAVLATRIGTSLASDPQAYRNLFGAAERQTRLVDSMFGEEQAREEAYERRIKAVRDATGIELENPERGGYRLTERELRRLTAEGPIDPAAYRRLAFEGHLREAQQKHPDQAEAITFGSIDDEARAIARGAEEDYTRARAAPGLDTPASLVTEFAGAFWAHRRDPLFVGSLFAGPTGAAGRTVAARIVSAGVRQGLYNAGLAALEQPTVQAWRQELGLRSGLVPAVENVGLAFLFGAIPGAALRGGAEALAPATRQSVERVLAGLPEPGDIEAATKAVGEALAPQEAAAARMGEEMDAAARVTQPAPARGVSRETSDDLLSAAMRQADDPMGSPSPAAVVALDQLQQKRPLTLEKVHSEPEGSQYPESWSVADEAGNQIATISAKIEGNTARIENIYAGRNPSLATSPEELAAILQQQQNALGPAAVRNILRQFMEQNPNVERITGERISGARLGGGYNADRGIETEVQARIAAAQPETLREAQMATSEALEDIGNRETMARTTDDLAAGKQFYTLEETFEAPAAAAPARSKDPLDKIPLMRDDGTPTLVSARQAAKAGERETQFAELIRACK